MTLLGNSDGFNYCDIRQLQLIVTQLFNRFGQMLVNEHHFASIDGLAQGAVYLERHATSQNTGLGQLFVQIVAQAGAGHQGDFQGRCFSALGQCFWDGLGFAGTGKTAHADGHAVLDKGGGFFGAHDLIVQGI